MQVERFFHIRPHSAGSALLGVSAKGGATVRVIGDPAQDTVSFSVAYCSGKDAFCRRTGRATAKQHAITTTLRRSLPSVLQDVARNVTKRVLKLSRKQRQEHHLWNTDYSFATKYFEEKKVINV